MTGGSLRGEGLDIYGEDITEANIGQGDSEREEAETRGGRKIGDVRRVKNRVREQKGRW